MKSFEAAKRILSSSAIAIVLGCASVPGTPEAAPQKGVVEESFLIPKSKRKGSGVIMGGAPGLARVDDDIIYEDPQHFLYTVRLDDGRKITVRNKGEFAVGACATLWLKVDPQSREGHYPLNFNDIQAGSGCKASAQSGPHK